MNKNFIFWCIALALFIGLITLFSEILTPFIAGFILAYLFNPVANKLQNIGASRNLATVTILFIVTGLIIITVTLIAPVIFKQVTDLVSKFPAYLEYFNTQIIPKLSDKLAALSFTEGENLQSTIQDHLSDFTNWIGKFITGVVSSGFAIYDIISILIITPIVTYYLIRDWSTLSRKITNAFPIKHKQTIKKQLEKVDLTLSGFFRGQGIVCLIMGIYYAISLSILHLSFGFFIGFTTGILTFIPYVGATIGLTLSLIVAAFQFGSWDTPLIIMALFAIGQTIESNILAPKLVGDNVGLHPLWIIFSLLAGANLFGFVGILLAVPVTALIGVLCRFLFEQYLKSSYYHEKKHSKSHAKTTRT